MLKISVYNNSGLGIPVINQGNSLLALVDIPSSYPFIFSVQPCMLRCLCNIGDCFQLLQLNMHLAINSNSSSCIIRLAVWFIADSLSLLPFPEVTQPFVHGILIQCINEQYQYYYISVSSVNINSTDLF